MLCCQYKYQQILQVEVPEADLVACKGRWVALLNQLLVDKPFQGLVVASSLKQSEAVFGKVSRQIQEVIS